jgi:hypothetical protein
MSKALGKARGAARITAAERARDGQFDIGVNGAFDRVVPGEFGEPAVAQEATIEQFQSENGDAPPVKVFISDMEEAVDYTPEEARRLAFSLLAMADVSEALYKLGSKGK